MLDVAIAQLRFAVSMVTGRRFSRRSLDRLVEGVLATQREFGEAGSQAAEQLRGPALDDETRRHIQLRRFRAQAVRAVEGTEFYQGVFRHLGGDPARLGYDDINAIPRTTKDALRVDPDAFVHNAAKPLLQCMTSGTTGRPTSVHFSEYELETLVALSALAFLLDRQIGPDDVVHIGTSSRAVLGNLGITGACAHIGALSYVAGVIPPVRALAMLAEDRRLTGRKRKVSVLSAYSSYLGELVETAARTGYTPSDFGVERILVGGEVVTRGLVSKAQDVFGQVDVVQSYAATETIPCGGLTCGDGHLHFEASHGLLEVVNPDTGTAAAHGEAGTIVATPFRPFRESTILLRYDTEDLVRPVEGPLTCHLRSLPATTQILGRRGLSVRHDLGWTFPREILEALECLDEVPLPARCGFRAVPGGVEVEAVVRNDTTDVRQRVGASLEAHGVPVRRLRLVTARRDLHHPLPLRCDLREAEGSGTGSGALLGA